MLSLGAKRVAVVLLALLIMAGASGRSTRSRAAVDAPPSTLEVEVTDDAGQPLLARLRIVPSSWAERARLGMWRDVHVRSDQALTLADGSYKVVVSRGPEWSIASFPLQVAGGRPVREHVELRHEIWLPGYRAADLHVHSAHSDDAKERGGVRGYDLKAEGIELAVGTDHNHIGRLSAGVDSVAGAELTTWAPEVGHFNAFPLRALPSFRGTTPRRLFEELRRDPHVFVQINHPRLEDHISYFALGGFDGQEFANADFSLGAHGIELWNGYDLARPEAVQALLAEWRALLARGHRLTATGGSDSHGPRGHFPGYPRSYVRTDDADGLAPALQAGRAFVTNGPLLSLEVQGQQPGETVHVHEHAATTVSLTVLAPSWMRVARAELWADERRVWAQKLPVPAAGEPLRFTAHLRLPLGQSRTLQAVVTGGSGLSALLGRSDVSPLAFTNPVYLTHGRHKPAGPQVGHLTVKATSRHEVVP